MTTLVARPVPARRGNEQRHALVAVAHVRLMILMLLIMAGFVLVIGRIALLGILSAPAGAANLAVNPQIRGDILDRNGQPLARTIDSWTIGVRPPQLLGDRQDLADSLARLMPGHDAGWYFQKLTMLAKFTYLEKHASRDSKVLEILGSTCMPTERHKKPKDQSQKLCLLPTICSATIEAHFGWESTLSTTLWYHATV